MTKKELFIKEIEESNIKLSEEALIYFEVLKGGSDKEKPAFTDNGRIVLSYMKDNKDSFNNLFKAKSVAEGIGITSRTVSGACRKLVTDGYLEKIGENPVCYSLTDKGVTVTFETPEVDE